MLISTDSRMKEVTAEAETVPATATKSKAAKKTVKKIVSRPSTARATLLRTKEDALIPGSCEA